MARKHRQHTGWLAAALIVAATAVPAHALDLGDRSKGLGASVDVGSNAGGLGVDVGATVGRSNGINADSNTAVGGSKGLVDSGTTASVGGSKGVNAAVDANVGGSGGVDATAKATVGGSDGLNANAGVNIGGKTGVGIGVGTGSPATPGATGSSGRLGVTNGQKLAPVLAGMSDTEIVALKRRCGDVLGHPSAYDRDLGQLCMILRKIGG